VSAPNIALHFWIYPEYLVANSSANTPDILFEKSIIQLRIMKAKAMLSGTVKPRREHQNDRRGFK
jgi:hypothetical protein